MTGFRLRYRRRPHRYTILFHGTVLLSRIIRPSTSSLPQLKGGDCVASEGREDGVCVGENRAQEGKAGAEEGDGRFGRGPDCEIDGSGC